MDGFLLKYLLLVFIVSVVIYQYIYWFIILPALKTQRKVYWSEWLGWNYNCFSYLDEYKEYCKQNYLPLSLHRFLWGLFYFNLGNVVICFLISVAI